MPISKLYVEGKLDNEIYAQLFGDSIAVKRGGSKYSIRPQARDDRSDGIQAGYLRDRDFDFDPPDDMDVLTVDATDRDQAWGWRLNRHEIESYLLDPQVVEAKFGINAETWQNRLCNAAQRIQWYQIARWTVGYARSRLPPYYELQTRPDDVGEMRLPPDLSEQVSLEWCRGTINKFLTRIDQCLCDDAVSEQIASRSKPFSDEMLDSHQHVLQWCSGKDLFAALTEPDLRDTSAESPQTLCNILRDWVRDNPNTFVDLFPEFTTLKQQMTDSASPQNTTPPRRQSRRIQLND